MSKLDLLTGIVGFALASVMFWQMAQDGLQAGRISTRAGGHHRQASPMRFWLTFTSYTTMSVLGGLGIVYLLGIAAGLWD